MKATPLAVIVFIFFIFLIFNTLTLNTNDLLVQEKYFTELRGMEDSLGNTHLFYRIHETFRDESNTVINMYHNVYHYDVVSSTEKIKFEDYSLYYFGYRTIDDYRFWDNNPDKWITGGMNSPLATIIRYDRIDSPSHLTIGGIALLQISQQNDSLVFATTGDGLAKSEDGGYTWPHSDENPDEFLPFGMLSLHTYDDQIMYGIGMGGSLVKSTDRGESYTIVDDTDEWRRGSIIYYDPDSVYIYGVTS